MTKTAESISIAQYRTLITKSRAQKNKFNAKRVTNEDGSFDSTGEARRYAILQQEERLGFIFNLRRQISFPLYCGERPLLMLSERTGKLYHVRYVADFVYEIDEHGQLVIEDFKGHDTPASRLKRAILSTMTNARIIVTKKV